MKVLSIGFLLIAGWLALAIGVAAIRNSGDGDGDAGTATADVVVAAESELVVDVELGDLYVKPNRIEVEPGQRLVLNVSNAGAMPHDLKLNGETGTAFLNPGDSETIELGPFEANAEAWCTIPGHKEAGMLLNIVVTGDTGGATEPADHQTASGDHATIDPNAAPDDSWAARDPVLPPAPQGTEHHITLEATEVQVEVAPGVMQEMWTFNDQVPGPILRGKVGDVFVITLVNKGKLGHSIDFHASKVAWDDEMRTIGPGESLEYRFEAKHAGVFMYHCGTPPTLHHIGNGMYGAIVIDPPDLAPVDKEFVLVQSELYLGPDGQPGDLTKMQNDDWDAVVFNGYFNQYLHSPIQVDPDDRIRVWVMNDGPSENSSFHIVGTVFDTVYKEGEYLLRPGPGQGGSQALDLQPAQGGFVEFTFDENGLYPIVTHKFSNVGKGALGLFQAGEPHGNAVGGH